MVSTRLLRYLWASPNTLVGLVFAAAAITAGRALLVDGVLEAHGPWLRWILRRVVPLRGGALAITLGHVVIGRDRRALEATREHERVHVVQYERLGPLFIPAYFAASLWALTRGGHPYFDNAFERQAIDAERRDNQPVKLRVGPGRAGE
jgi:hypothetical protein